MDHILVTGSLGQLGSELVPALQVKYGRIGVIATDNHPPAGDDYPGQFHLLDVLNKAAIQETIEKYQITQIYHLAAILSANAEKNPALAWRINMDGLLNVLEIAREAGISKVFWPSSIAVFGPDSPKTHTPQNTLMNPNTIYGITKVAGEKLCAYYNEKFDMDIRSLRYPGLVGYKSLPGGGTTDYAVEIYHQAARSGSFTCPLAENTALPMMYMPDAVRATLELMAADKKSLCVKTSYNLAGISFAPKEIYAAIVRHCPDFMIAYSPDFRQQIAASWPDSIDDSAAQKDWNGKWRTISKG